MLAESTEMNAKNEEHVTKNNENNIKDNDNQGILKNNHNTKEINKKAIAINENNREEIHFIPYLFENRDQFKKENIHKNNNKINIINKEIRFFIFKKYWKWYNRSK